MARATTARSADAHLPRALLHERRRRRPEPAHLRSVRVEALLRRQSEESEVWNVLCRCCLAGGNGCGRPSAR